MKMHGRFVGFNVVCKMLSVHEISVHAKGSKANAKPALARLGILISLEEQLQQ